VRRIGLLGLCLGTCLGLGACATIPGKNAPLAFQADSAPAKQLHTDLVREMIGQGRYYAALAHIEDLQKNGGPREELLLLHAQVLAKLGRKDQAEQEYRQLLGSAFEGEARHGLGLIYADKNYKQSLQFLAEAARLRATDPNIRNDYGYALLMGGQYPAARLQLATAFELDSGSDKYRNNYVLALLLLKDETELLRVRRLSDVSDKTLQNLRVQAEAWPAVVKRTLAAVVTPAPTVAPQAQRPSQDGPSEIRKKLRPSSNQ
jgi:Flp pilus assembly protein TadD